MFLVGVGDDDDLNLVFIMYTYISCLYICYISYI